MINCYFCNGKTVSDKTAASENSPVKLECGHIFDKTCSQLHRSQFIKGERDSYFCAVPSCRKELIEEEFNKLNLRSIEVIGIESDSESEVEPTPSTSDITRKRKNTEPDTSDISSRKVKKESEDPELYIEDTLTTLANKPTNQSLLETKLKYNGLTTQVSKLVQQLNHLSSSPTIHSYNLHMLLSTVEEPVPETLTDSENLQAAKMKLNLLVEKTNELRRYTMSTANTCRFKQKMSTTEVDEFYRLGEEVKNSRDSYFLKENSLHKNEHNHNDWSEIDKVNTLLHQLKGVDGWYATIIRDYDHLMNYPEPARVFQLEKTFKSIKLPDQQPLKFDD